MPPTSTSTSTKMSEEEDPLDALLAELQVSVARRLADVGSR